MIAHGIRPSSILGLQVFRSYRESFTRHEDLHQCNSTDYAIKAASWKLVALCPEGFVRARPAGRSARDFQSWLNSLKTKRQLVLRMKYLQKGNFLH